MSYTGGDLHTVGVSYCSGYVSLLVT